MQDLLEQAKKLGQMIADDQRTKSLKEMQDKLDKDEEAKQLLQEYQKQMEKIAGLEQSGSPIEVDDKHKMRDIQEKMASNETIKQITARQVDFVDMMNKVKTEIDKQIQIES